MPGLETLPRHSQLHIRVPCFHRPHEPDHLATQPSRTWPSNTTVTLPAVARGFSMGFCFMPVQTASRSTVPQPQMARATALSNSFMRVFGTFSSAFLTTVLHERTLFHYSTVASALTPGGPAVTELLSALQPDLIARGITSLDAQ